MGSIDKACISGFLCRLCSEMHRIVIHIYGDQGQRLCLVEKINGYLPITISPTDPLPKTICTTCLRRVEQHYDLLMRLSRIKEERFLRVNNKQRPRVSPISSIENSEDEVYQSDDESRRHRNQTYSHSQRQTSQSQQHLSVSATSAAPSLFPTTSSAGTLARSNAVIRANNINRVNDDDVDDDNSGASTSANALAAIIQTGGIETNVGDFSSTSSSINSVTMETGNNFGIVLPQHTD
ncbi:uncharacterized protein ACRADG_000745 [Cochliomyia hominivorax]